MGRKKVTEHNLVYELQERGLSRQKAYFLCMKYCPEALPKPCTSFAELKETFPSDFRGYSEKNFTQLGHYKEIQDATKWLLKRLDAGRDIELYNKYYELAMKGNVQALKAYMEFKDKFFANNTDDLMRLLSNIDFGDEEENPDEETAEKEAIETESAVTTKTESNNDFDMEI